MHDPLIYFLNFLFLFFVLQWAFSAYVEIWVYRNLKQAFKLISNLLRSKSKLSLSDPPDYIIVEGTYKGRRVVARVSRSAPSPLWHYSLSLHIYIEPLIRPKLVAYQTDYLTEHTQLEENNRIYYGSTSSTTVKSYTFMSKIPEDEFINIFEELTRAAEIAESKWA